jgi:hypothetical protein
MRAEIAGHMRRGAEQTENFLRATPDLSGEGKKKGGIT